MYQVEFHGFLFFTSHKPHIMLVKKMTLPFVPVLGMTYMDSKTDWEAEPKSITWDNSDQTFSISVESTVIDDVGGDFDYVQAYLESGWELGGRDKIAISEPSPSS